MKNQNSKYFPSKFRACLYRDCLGFSRYLGLSNGYLPSTQLQGACLSLSWSKLVGVQVFLASLWCFSNFCYGDPHEHS